MIIEFGGRGLRGAVVLGLVMLALPLHAEPASSDSSPRKESIQRFETIEPGGRVRVVNRFGNVYARFGGYENRVELLATIQYLDESAPPLELRVDRLDGGIAVAVAPEGVDSASASRGERKDRIDLVLFVPQGATLDAETRDDLIEAKGLKGDLMASSISGDIRIRSIRGLVRAKSTRGHVTVALETGATREAQQLSTQTGEIEVYLWEDADMKVSLATSGEISTDFSLEIEHRRFEEPGKHAVAVVGDGGPRLELTSKQGRIRLLRLPKDFVYRD